MIIFATEKNGKVYVYDENENLIFSGSGSLDSYTNTTFAIVRNNKTYIYDAMGVERHVYPDFIDLSNICDAIL